MFIILYGILFYGYLLFSIGDHDPLVYFPAGMWIPAARPTVHMEQNKIWISIKLHKSVKAISESGCRQ